MPICNFHNFVHFHFFARIMMTIYNFRIIFVGFRAWTLTTKGCRADRFSVILQKVSKSRDSVTFTCLSQPVQGNIT